MTHTLTITVNDAVYKTLKPFIEQETVGAFLENIIEKDSPLQQKSTTEITALRGSLHQVDISNIREEYERAI